MTLIVVFAGGAFMSSGGLVTMMDMGLGMTLGELRGFYTPDVTAAQKKELEAAMESLRTNLRDGKTSVTRLDPVMQTMRKAIADEKVQPAEVDALAAAARKAAVPAVPKAAPPATR